MKTVVIYHENKTVNDVDVDAVVCEIDIRNGKPSFSGHLEIEMVNGEHKVISGEFAQDDYLEEFGFTLHPAPRASIVAERRGKQFIMAAKMDDDVEYPQAGMLHETEESVHHDARVMYAGYAWDWEEYSKTIFTGL